MTDYPTITADEARMGDVLRLTFETGETLQGTVRNGGDGLVLGPIGRAIYLANDAVTRIQRVQAAPPTLPTEPGRKVRYPRSSDTWTLGREGSWCMDADFVTLPPDRMPPGWVEVTTVPTDALKALADDVTRYGVGGITGPVVYAVLGVEK